MSKVAVVMPKWIGDFVMALSVVEEFVKRGNNDVTIIIYSYLSKLASTITPLPQINYNTKTGLSELKKDNYSEIYIFPRSFSSAFWAFRTGIKKRHGYRYEWRSFLLTRKLKITNIPRVKHIVTEYSRLLGIKEFDPASFIAKKYNFQKDDTIVLAPGAKYGRAKKWPYFSEVISCLKSDKFVILGSEGDNDTAEKIAKQFPDRVKNLCGKTSLKDATKIIGSAKAMISNDSGLMHLSAFIGTPVVGIFGSSTPRWTAPIGKNNRVVWLNEDCSPCFERECKYSDYHCLENIRVDEVISKYSDLIDCDI